jgi:hypothetical protein
MKAASLTTEVDLSPDDLILSRVTRGMRVQTVSATRCVVFESSQGWFVWLWWTAVVF